MPVDVMEDVVFDAAFHQLLHVFKSLEDAVEQTSEEEPR